MARNGHRAVDRYQVACTIDASSMDKAKRRRPVCLSIWLDNPHSSVFVEATANIRKPLNKSCGIGDTLMLKTAKLEKAGNRKPSWTLFAIGVDKNAVVTSRAIPP